MTSRRIASSSVSSSLIETFSFAARRWKKKSISIGSALPGQAGLEVPPHIRPLGCEDAVDHGVAHRAVAPRGMVADHPILLRAERLDRPLRGEVEVVRTQPHDPAVERVESMAKQQQLAGRVDVALLPAARVPRV